MRFPFLILALFLAGPASAAGLLIPDDKKLPPLAMVNHRVTITIDDQVAVTTVEQSFRNHTDRQLEATYLFPIPKGASVDKFTMWVGETETTGELLDSKKASQVYTDIVRRTQDPGILEYMGNNLMRLKVFPILPHKDQKVKISFTYVATQDNGVVEYIYPLKTDGKATKTLEEFSVKATIKSQHPIQNVYSPTHAIALIRKGDKEVTMSFERNQAVLDKDFQLFYSVGNKEIGITPLYHRPSSAEDGYFLMLVSPQLESSKDEHHSYKDAIHGARSGYVGQHGQHQDGTGPQGQALKHLLGGLNAGDRFAIISFSTTVRTYRDNLVDANSEQLDNAKKWVDGLKAGGGTAIQAALDSALEMRVKQGRGAVVHGRVLHGWPADDWRNASRRRIVKNVEAKANSANTRIFTFGVGDDVNTAAARPARRSTRNRALSQDLCPLSRGHRGQGGQSLDLYGEDKPSGAWRTVRLTTSENIEVHEVFPPAVAGLVLRQPARVVLGKYKGRRASGESS